jgi:hypothetical protein
MVSLVFTDVTETMGYPLVELPLAVKHFSHQRILDFFDITTL